MREESVELDNIEVTKLVSSIKDHVLELGLTIIHEDNGEGFWSLHAHTGGTRSIITGSIRDVEILITGSNKNYDLIFRTGAWGRDIAIPALLASAVSLGAGAVVAGAEAYRAHRFEKNFWEWLTLEIKSINGNMTQPHQASGNEKVCTKCEMPVQEGAKFCMHCGSPQ